MTRHQKCAAVTAQQQQPGVSTNNNNDETFAAKDLTFVFLCLCLSIGVYFVPSKSRFKFSFLYFEPCLLYRLNISFSLLTCEPNFLSRYKLLSPSR